MSLQRNRKESSGKEVEVMWACDGKRGAVRRKWTMEMKVQGKRQRQIPKRRWLDKVKDDIKEKRRRPTIVLTLFVQLQLKQF